MLLDQILQDLTEHLTENLRVTRLNNCLTNRLYQVKSETGQFALRVNSEKAASLGIDRTREQSILNHLRDQSWCLHPVALSPDYMLTPWVTSVAIDVDRQLDELIQLIKQVHSTNIESLDTPRLNINAQLDHLSSQAPNLLGEFKTVLNEYQNMYQSPTKLKLCHHDWHIGNIYQQNAKLLLNDWEYAAPGDPLVDIVCFVQGLNLNPKLEEYTLSALGYSAAQLKNIHPLVEAMSILWFQVRFPDKDSTGNQTDFINKWVSRKRSIS